VKLRDLSQYEQRLRERRTETDADIARRLETARAELARSGEYQHQIINENLAVAAAEFCQLLRDYQADLARRGNP